MWRNRLWDSTLQRWQCLKLIAWKFNKRAHLNCLRVYNLPQFVLVANNNLRELGFVNRGCLWNQCCWHSCLLVWSKSATKKIEILCCCQKNPPAREKEGDDKVGQDCDGPKYSSKGWGIWQMRPSMQSCAAAKIPNIVCHPPPAVYPQIPAGLSPWEGGDWLDSLTWLLMPDCIGHSYC